jgi:hypothetical protein
LKVKPFIEKYLQQLLKNEQVQDSLEKAQDQNIHLKNLTELLQMAHKRYVIDYHTRSRFGRIISFILRILGLAADLAGSYLFWFSGIGSGMGLKFAGFGLKMIAELVETIPYRRQASKLKKKGVALPGWSISLEIVLSRILAYFPYFVFELFDFARSSRKYRMALHRRAARQALKAYILSLKSPGKSSERTSQAKRS